MLTHIKWLLIVYLRYIYICMKIILCSVIVTNRNESLKRNNERIVGILKPLFFPDLSGTAKKEIHALEFTGINLNLFNENSLIYVRSLFFVFNMRTN